MEVMTQRLAAIGQSHVLEHFPKLTESQQAALLKQLSSLPLEKLKDIFQTATATHASTATALIDPPPQESLKRRNDAKSSVWRSAGDALIAGSKCAVCILAGGQATRLGVPYPKGMLVLPDLASGKSLFQIQAEKVLKSQMKGGGKIPFLLMTSEATHNDVTKYFEEKKYFGLDPSQVRVFQQGTLPCMTDDAKMVLESEHRVAVAPNGNGGIYLGLRESGTLEFLKTQGVKYVQVFSVDNPLSRIADSVFYGMCEVEGFDVAAKCTPKTTPQEAVGVFSLRDGRWGVTEYSEIGVERAAQVDPDTKQLKFNAANLAIHCYTLDFLEQAAARMDRADALYHVARKDIPCSLSQNGKTPAIKMEAFIFDVFGDAKNFGLMEVVREEEFSAVKNAEGAARDTPSTARRDMDALHRKWLLQAGAKIESVGFIEISPLLSLEGEGLSSYSGVTVAAPAYLQNPHILSKQ
eukprot:PhF_6_TR42901/c0_g1_i1/m.65004/K00972/UAP1; UDP-N-acetylglucosamine/UDP-N-acetylgalactosamine diphosphorylase